MEAYSKEYFLLMAIYIWIAYKTVIFSKNNPKKALSSLKYIWLYMTVQEIARIIFEQVKLSGNWINVFPFKLCSMPLYLLPIYFISKNERVKQAIADFLSSFSLFGAAIAFAEPSGLLQSTVFATAHSLIWHFLIIVVALIFIHTDKALNKKTSYKDVLTVYGILVLIAQALNLWIRDKSYINLFFISPLKESPLVVFNIISKTIGYVSNGILFVILLALVGLGTGEIIRRKKRI